MKNLFTITVLLLMLAFSSKTFAQFTAGTPMAPSEEQTVTYTLNGMTPGDDFVYGVNIYTTLEDVDYTSGGDFWEFPSGNTGEASIEGHASVQIQWLEGASDYTYYVWITITDSDGCNTSRHLLVNPEEATPVDEDYPVVFNIIAIGTGDDSGIINSTNGTDERACPTFVDADWQFETLTDGTHDGSSYVYFQIEREAISNGQAVTDSWEIVTALGTGSVTATSWEYGTALNSSAFQTLSDVNSTITVGNGDILYLRALVTNGDTDSPLTVNISGGNDTSSEFDNPITYTSESASLTVSPVPSVGDFSLSK
ncbi:MAG: hypothetical protein JXR50_02125 [Prolixibacteraceae bacterium]|nr:hypothetical protein [Prolixibacteraceae bacterium]MBN2648515.1 hypothetical protein [Prolixibacteraceae bacterium]